MRYILASLSVASVLVLAGCGEERVSMKVVPDRNDHAYTDDASKGGSSLPNVPIAGEGEIYVTTGPKDTLTSVAKKYGTTVEQLIRRNDLKNGLPPVGSNLIVPKPK